MVAGVNPQAAFDPPTATRTRRAITPEEEGDAGGASTPLRQSRQVPLREPVTPPVIPRPSSRVTSASRRGRSSTPFIRVPDESSDKESVSASESESDDGEEDVPESDDDVDKDLISDDKWNRAWAGYQLKWRVLAKHGRGKNRVSF